jgi:hypothetical protein
MNHGHVCRSKGIGGLKFLLKSKGILDPLIPSILILFQKNMPLG